MTTDKFSENIVADLQTNMVMGFLEQGLIKEAESKLEEFGRAISKTKTGKIPIPTISRKALKISKTNKIIFFLLISVFKSFIKFNSI